MKQEPPREGRGEAHRPHSVSLGRPQGLPGAHAAKAREEQYRRPPRAREGLGVSRAAAQEAGPGDSSRRLGPGAQQRDLCGYGKQCEGAGRPVRTGGGRCARAGDRSGYAEHGCRRGPVRMGTEEVGSGW